jgi:hypothetical protein
MLAVLASLTLTTMLHCLDWSGHAVDSQVDDVALRKKLAELGIASAIGALRRYGVTSVQVLFGIDAKDWRQIRLKPAHENALRSWVRSMKTNSVGNASHSTFPLQNKPALQKFKQDRKHWESKHKTGGEEKDKGWSWAQSDQIFQEMGHDSEIPPSLLFHREKEVSDGLVTILAGGEDSGEFDMRSTEEMMRHVWRVQHPAGKYSQRSACNQHTLPFDTGFENLLQIVPLLSC